MTDDLVEQIKRDRAEGTLGKWLIDETTVYTLRSSVYLGNPTYENAWQAHFSQDGQHKTPLEEVKANARRTARVPDMEARIVADAEVIKAAEELADRVERFNKDLGGPNLDWYSVVFALAAFRKAQEGRG